jgi:hypothetical protein
LKSCSHADSVGNKAPRRSDTPGIHKITGGQVRAHFKHKCAPGLKEFSGGCAAAS